MIDQFLAAAAVIVTALWMIPMWHVGKAVGMASVAALRQGERAGIWHQAYEQGVEDERMAVAVGLPEYGPHRNNPYESKVS